MAKIEQGHFISSQLEDQDVFNVIKDESITLAFGADAFRSGNVFAKCVRKRYQKTGKVNPTVAGEMLDDMGIEFAVRIDESGIQVVRYEGSNRYNYDSISGRDGDLINGVYYGQIKSKVFRNRLIKRGVRINRHHRNRIGALG